MSDGLKGLNGPTVALIIGGCIVTLAIITSMTILAVWGKGGHEAAIITPLITLPVTLLGMILTYLKANQAANHSLRAEEVAKTTHTAINSRVDQLTAAIRKEGVQEGRDQVTGEAAAAAAAAKEKS